MSLVRLLTGRNAFIGIHLRCHPAAVLPRRNVLLHGWEVLDMDFAAAAKIGDMATAHPDDVANTACRHGKAHELWVLNFTTLRAVNRSLDRRLIKGSWNLGTRRRERHDMCLTRRKIVGCRA